jgi:hypothetical protein
MATTPRSKGSRPLPKAMAGKGIAQKAVVRKPTGDPARTAAQAQHQAAYLPSLADSTLEPDLLRACMTRLAVEPTAFRIPAPDMVKHAQEVAGLCHLAGMRAEAPRYVGAGVSVEVVRHQLLTLTAELAGRRAIRGTRLSKPPQVVTAPGSLQSAGRSPRGRRGAGFDTFSAL